MIVSAEEFIKLRTSDLKDEQNRATLDASPIPIWIDVISQYPDFKTWVIHNKTVPLEILTILANDVDPNVRADVARKRKINDKIFNLLAADPEENVRHALIFNQSLSKEKLSLIETTDSEWLQSALKERLEE